MNTRHTPNVSIVEYMKLLHAGWLVMFLFILTMP